MNDHNLDDLIIDEIEPAQSNKAKSFLTIIALAIVVLIVSIIFTKVMLKAPEQEELLFEQNETELISPDLTLQSAPEPQEESEEPIAATKEENGLKIPEEMAVEKVTEKIPAPKEEVAEAPQEAVTVEQPEEVEKPVNVPAPKPLETETEPIPATMPKPVEEKSTDILNIVEEPAKTEPKPIQPIQQTVQRPTNTITQTVQTQRPANVITRPHETHTKYTSRGNYYIQVGAFSQTPNKRFLAKITRNGFTYTITKRSPRGLKKLLIGPYSNQKSAERALIKVQKLINKRAFLLKKK
ncbi:SPOR domain-containing protein [Sulfurovum mangrovi]|uniref:SPOR domain-containing protein n=1 Tax=Sulfurovum mangrovi TaxID=2893889 RepID=UPI001E5C9844|nr:SPOR domain-containing protein [Sulfurovum mangrovi]UFH59715.1 SPOR domain-containing protein [Sulfurovum mangrovi]UFH60861.1 SPOR domain-containing protein [Sulfurovum mangrovi]